MIPDFTKVSWASGDIKKLWEPKIHKFQELLRDVESQRPFAILSVSAEDLPKYSIKAAKDHRDLVVLDVLNAQKNYSNVPTAYTGGRAEFRVLIAHEDVSYNTVREFTSNNHKLIGQLLGYPECCINSFASGWGKEWFDPTPFEYRERQSKFHFGHIMLRQMGLRFCFHLPCKYDCLLSNGIGKLSFDLMLSASPSAALDGLRMMKMPVTWTGLHGIAEVTTPLFKYVTKTNHTNEKIERVFEGVNMPNFGEAEWKDNGFSSPEVQDLSHDPIIHVFLRIIRLVMRSRLRIIDYGCGNAALLEKLNLIYPATNLFGIDFNDLAIKHAYERIPDGDFAVGNVFDGHFSGRLFDISLISVQRLKEVPLEVAQRFIQMLKANSAFAIFYNYVDTKNLPIVEELEKFGIQAFPGNVYTSLLTEATFVRFK